MKLLIEYLRAGESWHARLLYLLIMPIWIPVIAAFAIFLLLSVVVGAVVTAVGAVTVDPVTYVVWDKRPCADLLNELFDQL